MTDEPIGTGRGFGKLILFGEHTVVYGTPAVVGSLERGAEATARWSGGDRSWVRVGGPGDHEPTDAQQASIDEAFEAIVGSFGDQLSRPVEVEVEVGIPVGVGLGSSAAFCAAAARSVAALAGLEEADSAVTRAVEAGEEIFHGNPSGIDQSAALEGGLQFYRPGDPTERAPIEVDGCRLGVCVAGPPAPTAEMVSGVANFREREADLFEYIKLLVGDTARFASGAMRSGDWSRVGELMDVNHGALSSLGVTTAELDRACHVARGAGALGAKLTGAGGGGCIVALLDGDANDVLEAWRAEGWECFEVQF